MFLSLESSSCELLLLISSMSSYECPRELSYFLRVLWVRKISKSEDLRFLILFLILELNVRSQYVKNLVNSHFFQVFIRPKRSSYQISVDATPLELSQLLARFFVRDNIEWLISLSRFYHYKDTVGRFKLQQFLRLTSERSFS